MRCKERIEIRVHRWAAWRLGALFASLASIAWAAGDLAPLRAQFQLPDEQVDYAAAKLMMDHLIDPSTEELKGTEVIKSFSYLRLLCCQLETNLAKIDAELDIRKLATE